MSIAGQRRSVPLHSTWSISSQRCFFVSGNFNDYLTNRGLSSLLTPESPPGMTTAVFGFCLTSLFVQRLFPFRPDPPWVFERISFGYRGCITVSCDTVTFGSLKVAQETRYKLSDLLSVATDRNHPRLVWMK